MISDVVMITVLLIVYLTTPEISFGTLSNVYVYIRVTWLVLGILMFVGEALAFFENYHIKIKTNRRVYDIDKMVGRVTEA